MLIESEWELRVQYGNVIIQIMAGIGGACSLHMWSDECIQNFSAQM